MNSDFHKDHGNTSKGYFFSLGFITIAILIFGLPVYNETSGAKTTLLNSIRQFPLPLPDASNTELSNTDPGKKLTTDLWYTAIVKPGDSLIRLFSRLDLDTTALYTLLSCCDEAKSLNRLLPGQIVKIHISADGSLRELIHEVNETRKLRLVRQGDTFTANAPLPPLEKRIAFASGTVDKSLYQSALQARLSDQLIEKFVEIFSWDIDMALHIDSGDGFTVIYEEYYRKGEKVNEGTILAAEFANRGKVYRAVRYTDKTGNTYYYTPQGRVMRQAFLRSPVDFRRISSHFQAERWHPVLGVKRPHKGVDYAAPVGTPVWAAGDGVVQFIGRQSGYGNVIILQHGKRYTTLYGHLSRFQKGLRRGQRVKQGNIIGYVGQTGLATGPHLHYEFRIDGNHIDPISAKLPRALPMNPKQRADFRTQTAGLIAQLDILGRTRIALLGNEL